MGRPTKVRRDEKHPMTSSFQSSGQNDVLFPVRQISVKECKRVGRKPIQETNNGDSSLSERLVRMFSRPEFRTVTQMHFPRRVLIKSLACL